MALNREQLTVINELNENIMLLASAGTGKTETLARRVANIIETKFLYVKNYMQGDTYDNSTFFSRTIINRK